MIYRFKSKLATHDRVEAFPIGVPGTDRRPVPGRPQDYEQRFDVEAAGRSLKILKAPEIDSRRYGVSLQISCNKEKEIFPDIWSHGMSIFCSERFKGVVEAQDRMEHQFIPLMLVNEDYQVIRERELYYWFHPRRFVRFGGGESKCESNKFEVNKYSEFFLGSLQCEAGLYRELEAALLWRVSTGDPVVDRVHGAYSILYMNEQLVGACDQSGIGGMSQYSIELGKGEESLVAIPFIGGKTS